MKGYKLSLLISILFASTSCSLDGIVSVEDPEGGARELDHSSVKSKFGAIGTYNSAVAALRTALSELSRDVALFTDEVQPVRDNSTLANIYRLDSRTLVSTDLLGNEGVRFGSVLYQSINAARVRALQARTLLREYGDSSTLPRLANAFAVEGYATLFLAENGCSGMPLTYVPFEGGVEYTRGYSTVELFTRAVGLFDSALAIVHDSLQYKTLASIGLGRAYSGLGKFNEAASAVDDIDENSMSFRLIYTEAVTPGGSLSETLFWTNSIVASGQLGLGALTYVENHEGGSGLQWISPLGQSQDSRIPVNPSNNRQQKFVGGAPTVTLAGWIDAKMIQAEALLNQQGLSGDSWLEPINEARRYVGLSDTTDPGTSQSRVDLLFRERAFWFYLTGTRLGDMRRLVRQYGRLVFEIYPTGGYNKTDGSTQPILFYGDHFVFMPPVEELRYNYLYEGCEHTNP